MFRTDIPEKFILQKNSQTGIIRYSSAELTAVDLVQYNHYVGGLARVATLLSELVELTDFSNKIISLLDYFNISTFQRLGYILDEVLEEKEQADIIYKQLLETNKRLNYIILDIRNSSEVNTENGKWKIKINSEIDEI